MRGQKGRWGILGLVDLKIVFCIPDQPIAEFYMCYTLKNVVTKASKAVLSNSLYVSF